MKRKWGIPVYFLCLTLAFFARKPLVQAMTVMSDRTLNGTYIVIDAGHGGNDPGARVDGQDEDEINLDLSKKLAVILEKAGATVELIRSDDYDLADEDAKNIKRSDMKHRADVINQNHVTLFVSIHCNTSADQRCCGSQVYYRKEDENSRKLADQIQHRLKDITESNYIPASADFYLLNETETLGVLVEAGFMTNSKDLNKLQDENYRANLAYAIYLGIHDFLEILL